MKCCWYIDVFAKTNLPGPISIQRPLSKSKNFQYKDNTVVKPIYFIMQISVLVIRHLYTEIYLRILCDTLMGSEKAWALFIRTLLGQSWCVIVISNHGDTIQYVAQIDIIYICVIIKLILDNYTDNIKLIRGFPLIKSHQIRLHYSYEFCWP